MALKWVPEKIFPHFRKVEQKVLPIPSTETGYKSGWSPRAWSGSGSSISRPEFWSPWSTRTAPAPSRRWSTGLECTARRERCFLSASFLGPLLATWQMILFCANLIKTFFNCFFVSICYYIFLFFYLDTHGEFGLTKLQLYLIVIASFVHLKDMRLASGLHVSNVLNDIKVHTVERNLCLSYSYNLRNKPN